MEITKDVLAGRHVLITGGSKSGKTQTLTQLLNDVVPTYFYPREVAALTVTRSSMLALAADLTPLVEVNTLHEAAQQASADWELRRRDDVYWQRRDSFASRYLALIRQVADVGDSEADRRFLRQAERHVGEALRLHARARRVGDDVLAQWLAAPGELAPGFVAEVTERYEKYKEERQLADATDLQLSAGPDPNVRLVVVDDAEDLSWAQAQFLARAYPAASLVFAGNPDLAIRNWEDLVPLHSLPHDVLIPLPANTAAPDTWLIDSPQPAAGLVPPPTEDALVILGGRGRYAFARWANWCTQAGLGFRVEGWKGWYCDGAPYVHITNVERCKGRAADTVIIDAFTMRPRRGDEDLGPARWQLARSRARRRLIVLQHETNKRLRAPDSGTRA